MYIIYLLIENQLFPLTRYHFLAIKILSTKQNHLSNSEQNHLSISQQNHLFMPKQNHLSISTKPSLHLKPNHLSISSQTISPSQTKPSLHLRSKPSLHLKPKHLSISNQPSLHLKTKPPLTSSCLMHLSYKDCFYTSLFFTLLVHIYINHLCTITVHETRVSTSLYSLQRTLLTWFERRSRRDNHKIEPRDKSYSKQMRWLISLSLPSYLKNPALSRFCPVKIAVVSKVTVNYW